MGRAFLLIFFSFILIAETKGQQNQINVHGYIENIETGERLPNATILVVGSEAGTVSNAYGYFSIRVNKTDTLQINYIGYSPLIIDPSEIRNLPITVSLEPVDNQLDEIIIEGAHEEKFIDSEQMSIVSLPIEQIKTIPVLLGEKDILKTVQLLPGVQTGKEGSAGIYVRGGGPDQNLIILDDAIVYNAFHMFGFFSVFNADAIKNIDLYKGGFPARYGGRLSSVLDIQMKDGNQQEWHGEGGIGLLSSRLTLEGSLIKGKSSVLISGRRSYADLFVNMLSPKGKTNRIYFGDLNIKVNYEFSDKSKLIFSNYSGKDVFFFRNSKDNQNNEHGYNWGNSTSTLRWSKILDEKIFINTSLIYSSYKFNIYEKLEFDQQYYERLNSSAIQDFSAKVDLDFFINPGYHIKYGLSAIRHRFSPRSIVVENTALDSVIMEENFNYSNEYAAYIENIWAPTNKIKLNAGLRFSTIHTDQKKYPQLEPRFSGVYKLNNSLSFKASYAFTQQNIHLLTSSGVGLPTDLWVSATDDVPPQTAWQAAIGVAKFFETSNIEFSSELYYKEMSNILAYKDGASFLFLGNAEDGSNIKPIDWSENVISGSGRSAGIEFFLHKKKGRLNGWVGYTLSYTKHQFDEINEGKEFWARYDRRHDISIVTSFQVNPKFKLNMNWVYGTGNALTVPYYTTRHYEHDIAFSPSTTIAYGYGSRNAFRAAPYHRLDIGAQFIKKKK